MHFNYIALDKLGKRLNGEVEAENTKAAADMLRAQALLPINISSEKSDVKKKFNVKNLFGKVPLVEKTSFIKNLAVMLKSGFPVSRALLVLSQQTSNVTLAEAIADISNQVQAGQPLAAAFARHPKVFSEMFVSMVKVGEVSGSLDQTLLDLGEQMKKDHDLIRKTRGAMIYPTVILTLMIVVGIVMFTFVLPKLTSLFLEFDVELPLVTRAIIGAVDFMEAFGVFILLALVALIVGAIYTLKIKSVRRLVDAAILRIPIIGKILMFTNLARFARTLSGLIKSGMPILDSIRVTGEALGNLKYREAIAAAGEAIRAGTPIATALEVHKTVFTPLLLSMVAVGEESGNIDVVLAEVAEFYEAEVDQSVSNFSSILEPVLMVVVGVVVAVLALGLIMPIYSITQSI